MIISKKTLNRFHPTHYTVNSIEYKKKVITAFLPYETGKYEAGKVVFPDYLKGYEEYYDYRYHCFNLKREYRLNGSKGRPTYTLEITYPVYDITFTPWGVETLESRYRSYKKLADEYGKLLG